MMNPDMHPLLSGIASARIEIASQISAAVSLLPANGAGNAPAAKGKPRRVNVVADRSMGNGPPSCGPNPDVARASSLTSNSPVQESQSQR
eukprot:4787028-Amphidinium_carterae.1